MSDFFDEKTFDLTFLASSVPPVHEKPELNLRDADLVFSVLSERGMQGPMFRSSVNAENVLNGYVSLHPTAPLKVHIYYLYSSAMIVKLESQDTMVFEASMRAPILSDSEQMFLSLQAINAGTYAKYEILNWEINSITANHFVFDFLKDRKCSHCGTNNCIMHQFNYKWEQLFREDRTLKKK
jgi:hypothetical protein